MATYRSFKDLECWQLCREVKVWTYEILEAKKVKDFDILSNMKRAARSTTRNIAEGYGRFHFKENIQFVRIARGSLTELEDDLDDLVLQGIVSVNEQKEGQILIDKAHKSVNGYILYLKNRLIKEGKK